MPRWKQRRSGALCQLRNNSSTAVRSGQWHLSAGRQEAALAASDRRSGTPRTRFSSVRSVPEAHDSPLAQALRDDALERFIRYARIDTQAARVSDTYPSTLKQLDLSRLLVDELRELGIADAQLTEHGYVFATLDGVEGPTVGLCAHVDVSPDAPADGVDPQVHAQLRRRRARRRALARHERAARRADRARHRHLRRDDAARRRRQGRRRGDHGRRRLARRAPRGAPRPRADRVHRRRGGRARRRPLRPRGLRRRLLLTRSTARSSARSRTRRGRRSS